MTKENSLNPNENQPVQHIHVHVHSRRNLFDLDEIDPREVERNIKAGQELGSTVNGLAVVFSILGLPIALLNHSWLAILPALVLVVAIWFAYDKHKSEEQAGQEGETTDSTTSEAIKPAAPREQDRTVDIPEVHTYLKKLGWIMVKRLSADDYLFHSAKGMTTLVCHRNSSSEIGADAILGVDRLQKKHGAEQVLITSNGVFTPGAKGLADQNQFELWDTYKLRVKIL